MGSSDEVDFEGVEAIAVDEPLGGDLKGVGSCGDEASSTFVESGLMASGSSGGGSDGATGAKNARL